MLETAWKRYDTILVSDAGLRMPPDADRGRRDTCILRPTGRGFFLLE